MRFELASVYPYFPPYYHISDDGTRIATGDMQTVEIREAATGELVSTIPAVLPDCDFGFDRYFRLNADGSFHRVGERAEHRGLAGGRGVDLLKLDH